MATAYRIQTDLFEGPLDLLLFLVERAEVEILRLPIAKITAQFIEFLEILEAIDLDIVGDFVVTASALVEIKSRAMLPQEQEEEVETEIVDEPRSDLIKQLLEYKKFKTAAQSLEEHAAEWQEQYPRLTSERPRSGKDPAADYIRDVELWDLVSALGRILRSKETESHANIRYDDTPISVHIERIGAYVREHGTATFSSFFSGEKERGRIVGVFLAILELVRHHGFRARQPNDYGEIWIEPPLEEGESITLTKQELSDSA